MLSFRFIVTDTANEWIGFWGGYLGSILGGVITLYVLWKTLKEEKKGKDRDEKILYFNEINRLWAQLTESTHDLCMFIQRCEKDKDNDAKEKVFREEARFIGIRTEMEVMLSTRKNVYETCELSAKVDILSIKEEKIIDLFERAVRVRFTNDELIIELENEISTLKNILEEVTRCLKSTIGVNLFQENS